ncbi:hypothetical protein SAMN05421747_11746 [Parapedobacter composti]|uniref:Uncharacterized protein n=1 Tax=Parapedobacter composti TaxID=623281 RepID=A0A1I1L0Y3_9SPHI|nr:hypothetical protein SAMN05421747_11746 [Parapedobacter composti]
MRFYCKQLQVFQYMNLLSTGPARQGLSLPRVKVNYFRQLFRLIANGQRKFIFYQLLIAIRSMFLSFAKKH